MTRKELFDEVGTILEQPPGSITGTEELADLPGWDSMSALLFIQMADTKLGMVVSAAQLLKCKNVSDLVTMCGDKVKD